MNRRGRFQGTIRRFTFFAVVVSFLCVTAWADSITAETGDSTTGAVVYDRSYDKQTPASISGPYGSAAISVDWATGQIHFSANADYGSGDMYWAGDDIQLVDILHVSGPVTSGTVTLGESLDGTFAGDTWGQSAQGYFELRTFDQYGRLGAAYYTQLTCPAAQSSCYLNGSVVAPYAPEYQLTVKISAGTYGLNSSSSLDFSHTAKLSFAVPTGDSFTSDSGTFLTAVQATTSVPEPASFWLCASGIAAGFERARRRRKKPNNRTELS